MIGAYQAAGLELSQISNCRLQDQPRIFLKLVIQMLPDVRDSRFAELNQLLVRFIVGFPEAVWAALAGFSLLNDGSTLWSSSSKGTTSEMVLSGAQSM
ncbi:hypothetical protein [Paenibacillus lautus]|uniref:Uncharacterized protein n=1 Tax=Paenibacillus lautus TaxID=1401 RepID=A0A385TV92_PAELA|nr:hypothetical protein [Paenibacillus lautus]AYB47391.1 hypothetical protein D5F53_30635 [Paenibacillus lautus]